MKKILTIAMLLLMHVTVSLADNNYGNFDPERYNRELEAAMTRDAKLTPQESQAFFPVFWEMQKKVRELFMKGRELARKRPASEAEALEIIKGIDANELAIKKLEQQYHARFLKILPASKVLACIRAEVRFNRNMMRDFAKQNVPNPQKPHFRPKK